jgi:hypothetical protein
MVERVTGNSCEAVAVLDEIFGNATDLPLGEHTVDTAGRHPWCFGRAVAKLIVNNNTNDQIRRVMAELSPQLKQATPVLMDRG